MTDVFPKQGTGYFQWNAGAWFGGLLGGTAYLGVGGVVFLLQDSFLGMAWLLCFAIASSSGVFLWRFRHVFAPYPAMQALLFVCGVGGATAMSAAYFLAPESLDVVQLTPAGSFLFLMVFPILMVWFHLLEMGSRQRANKA